MPYPKPLHELISAIATFQGISSKQAARIVFDLIRKDQKFVQQLGKQIQTIKQQLTVCSQCLTITDSEKKNKGLCEICRNPKRKRDQIIVVEKISDLERIEKTRSNLGTYHIIGKLFPRKRSQKDTIPASVKLLLSRIDTFTKKKKKPEIILGLNPTSDGLLASAYLKELIDPKKVKLTQLGRGIPTGGELEYADDQTLKESIRRRSTLTQ